MKNWLLVVTLFVFSPCALKAGEPFAIKAIAQGDLIHSTFEVTSEKLVAADDGRIQLSVTAEGNCRLERNPWDDVYPPDRPTEPPHEAWVCDEQEGVFELPQTVYLKGNFIVYDDGVNFFKLAKRKNFLFWDWLEVRDNVTIEVASPYNEAFVLVH